MPAVKKANVPVGIDLGTTYSCLSYLTPQGQPVTLANDEGELATPSAVFFDGKEVIVGTEALRHSVTMPERVVQYAKRYMGDPHKCWVFEGQVYRPKDISAFIVKKLLKSAHEQLGQVRHAVITVPAQFSELQRRDTVEAGLQAGLEHVNIINEPVAAALCYVLGEGMWFAELANEQTVLVFDLGGGTLDLSLVKYDKHNVRVIASGGDLTLGGLDWNKALQELVCDLFTKETSRDPRLDRESMQALSLEVEQAKRSLSVRPRSSLLVQHIGRRTAYSIDRAQFEEMTKSLVDRSAALTLELLKSHKMGWAHIDTVLATGGASRMPMIRNMLQRISGTTLNQALSPDQSITHGAAYYSGMLLSGNKVSASILDQKAADRLSNFKQQSVTGRSLGILVRNLQTNMREPHFLIPANTPLPCAYQQKFGTVTPNQKQVKLHIVESGTSATDPYVELGECVITELGENLPPNSPIEVTIRYDEQARVQVDAVDLTSGKRAQTTIVREVPPSPLVAAVAEPPKPAVVMPQPVVPQLTPPTPLPKAKLVPPVAIRATREVSDYSSEMPVALCNQCGEAPDAAGLCPRCRKPILTRAAPLVSSPAQANPDPQKAIKTEPMGIPSQPRPAIPLRSQTDNSRHKRMH